MVCEVKGELCFPQPTVGLTGISAAGRTSIIADAQSVRDGRALSDRRRGLLRESAWPRSLTQGINWSTDAVSTGT